jgi:Cys-rich repeat protein
MLRPIPIFGGCLELRFLLVTVPLVAVSSLALVDCSGSSSSTGLVAAGGTGGALVGPACASDATCVRPTPYCSGGRCVQCVGDANCTNGSSCDLVSHTCVECTTDAQCGMGTPYCSPAHHCVACLTATNCMTGQTCDTTNFRCVASCSSDAQCSRGNPYCNTTAMRCVQCLSSMQCMGTPRGGGAICDTATNRCVECLANTDCAMNQGNPYCDTAQNACVECVADANCMTGRTCMNGQCG